jgi:outer membrane murein-binding lipoprotein Lpp
MHSRTIAACVTAALLSSGLLSAVAARTPGRLEDVTTYDAAAFAGQLHQLETTVAALRSRVDSLETELDAARPSPAVEQTVTAPFTVVNGAGTPIFTVSDRTFADAPTKGRVHIGRGSGANFGMWFINSSGSIAASLGESKAGPGVLIINKGADEVAVVDANGFTVNATGGKEVAHLGLDPQNRARARLVVRGPLSLTDEAGGTVVDAGAVGVGLGAVRAWPNANCKGGGLPACIKGN